MPEISRFYGITIKMYFDEHPPPHFHVEYGEYEAMVNTQWEKAKNLEPLDKIDPLK